MSDFDTTWAAKERALKDRIRAGGFAIALSGGGHRATLATLGALLAIVDRGLSAKVIQIASVSGGSITNAFVAQRCKFETLRPGELDGIATELAAAVVRKGVLTREWMALLLLSTVVFGAAAATLFRVFVVPWTWLAMAIGLVVALSLLIVRGLAVEWLLDRRYFRHSTTGYRPAHRAQLASLSGGDVDHVFCMTDLALGLPVYASSGCGGMMWRRLKVEPSSRDIHERPPFHTFDAGKLSIAELVRASAAFPGISPRRLPIPHDPDIDMVSESPRAAFLSDGGLWNNLATHVMREDGFIGTYCDKDSKGIPRPYWEGMHRDIPLLCFNGSAPLQPSHPWAFSVPGVALLKTLLQTANILNANTVLPRVAAMQMAFQRRARRAEQSSEFDPINLVVDLTGVRETARRHSYGFLRDPSPEDISSYDSPIIGRAKSEDQRSLTDSPAWMQAVQEGDGRVDARTTLDRIDVNLARRLIARAYFNTYLVSLFLAPLSDQELDRLADFEFRLDQILGLRDKSEVKPSREPSASGSGNFAEQLVVRSDRESPVQNNRAQSQRVLRDAEAREAMEVLAEINAQDPRTHMKSVFLYELARGITQDSESRGWVLWFVSDVPGTEQLGIGGLVTLTVRDFEVAILIRRNIDETVSASHIIELTLRPTSPFFEWDYLSRVSGILMRKNERDTGTHLAGIVLEATRWRCLFGLSPEYEKENIQMLMEGEWLDILWSSENELRAILKVKKDREGESVFKKVLAAWKQ